MSNYYNTPINSFQLNKRPRYTNVHNPYTAMPTLGYHPDPWPSNYHVGHYANDNYNGDHDYTNGQQHMPYTGSTATDNAYEYYAQQHNLVNGVNENPSHKIYHSFNGDKRGIMKNNQGNVHGSDHDHAKKRGDSSALSALTLLSFFFFINLLQNCIKDHMDAMNPTVMVMTQNVIRKNPREGMPRNDGNMEYVDTNDSNPKIMSNNLSQQLTSITTKYFEENRNPLRSNHNHVHEKSKYSMETLQSMPPEIQSHHSAIHSNYVGSTQGSIYNSPSSTLTSLYMGPSYVSSLSPSPTLITFATSNQYNYQQEPILIKEHKPLSKGNYNYFNTTISLRPVRRASIVLIKPNN